MVVTDAVHTDMRTTLFPENHDDLFPTPASGKPHSCPAGLSMVFKGPSAPVHVLSPALSPAPCMVCDHQTIVSAEEGALTAPCWPSVTASGGGDFNQCSEGTQNPQLKLPGTSLPTVHAAVPRAPPSLLALHIPGMWARDGTEVLPLAAVGGSRIDGV